MNLLKIITLKTPCSSCLIRLDYIKKAAAEALEDLKKEGYDVDLTIVELSKRRDLRSVKGICSLSLPAVLINDCEIETSGVVDSKYIKKKILEITANGNTVSESKYDR